MGGWGGGHWKGGYRERRAGGARWGGGVLPGLERQRRGRGGGRIGRLLSGVAVARSGGGLGDFGWFWTLESPPARGRNAGSHQTASGPGLGAPPPRVAALGPLRQRPGAGSAPVPAGKVPRTGHPTYPPALPRDPADTARRPRGEPARGGSPRRAPAAGSPAPGALLSPRSRASIPAGGAPPSASGGQNLCGQPQRGHPGGFPQGHQERPERRAGRGGRSLLPPSPRQNLPFPPPPPPVRPGLTGDADDASPSPGRYQPRRAGNRALPGTAGTEGERRGCGSASQSRSRAARAPM